MVDAANLSIIDMVTTNHMGDVIQKEAIHNTIGIITIVVIMVIMDMMVVADLLTRTVALVPGSANTLRGGPEIFHSSYILIHALY
jgi:hypothetical protein